MRGHATEAQSILQCFETEACTLTKRLMDWRGEIGFKSRSMIKESEWKTRKTRIDSKLTGLDPAWKIVPFQDGMDTSTLDRHAIEEYPTSTGPADYALFVKGKLLGILEAKKVSVNPQNVLEQAKRYSKGAQKTIGSWNGYNVPFLYATNGEVIQFIDIRSDKSFSREISNFHTPDAMEELFERKNSTQWLTSQPTSDLNLRYYQERAIQKTEEAIINGKRSLLLAMATGTGKTRTTVSQIYRLIKSGAAKRILFLVDRRALAAQAVLEFNSFNTPSSNKFTQEYDVYSQKFKRGDLEDIDDEKKSKIKFDPKVLPEEYLTHPKKNHTFVYVSTIQRMAINLFGYEGAFSQSSKDSEVEEANQLDIPIHAFDVIIADECHRGYTPKDHSVWMKVLQHFDSIKIGLTATPAAHTMALFKNLVDKYTTEQAIEDGYLVDYDVVKIKSNVRINGVFLGEGEQVERVDTDTGQSSFDFLEDERFFDSTKIEKDITAPDSNRKIIEEIAKYAFEHEKKTGNFPKILIFADNDISHTSHADQIVKICREVFGQGDNFVQKITGNANVDKPLQKIREFRNRPEPKIVVTVDMLSTGVDIPPLEFVVFMRVIKSRILWVQMLGRGTRLCPEINKTSFTIFDCFNGSLIEYFDKAAGFDIDTSDKPSLPVKKVVQNIEQNIDREYFTKILVKRLHRIDRNMSANARKEFSKFIQDGDIKTFATELTKKFEDNFTHTIKMFKQDNFVNLLENYERAKRTFLVTQTEDQVDSEVIIKHGKDYLKPKDYLESFSEFVHTHEKDIEAIQVLTSNPKKWQPQTLNNLKKTLDQNDYPEEKLQKAHKIVSYKDLADIISIVKHAAREQEPIYNAEERVDRAIKNISKDKIFSQEQKEWIGLIREHLVENLTIELDDFQNAPIFERKGGLSKAKKVFGEELKNLIDEINYQLAA